MQPTGTRVVPSARWIFDRDVPNQTYKKPNLLNDVFINQNTPLALEAFPFGPSSLQETFDIDGISPGGGGGGLLGHRGYNPMARVVWLNTSPRLRPRAVRPEGCVEGWCPAIPHGPLGCILLTTIMREKGCFCGRSD